MTPCPYCLSEVDDAAVVCRTCTRDLYLFKPMMARIADLEAQVRELSSQQTLGEQADELVKDRNLKEMKDDVRSFKAQINGGDEVIFFYSGHGVQIEAMNYLLPVDVRADSEDQVRDDALALSRVLEDLRAQKPALTVAVIDACRDNPFKGTGRTIGGRGLTGVSGANGQMVIYSAGEGQQALDRLSDEDPVKNGLFTRVFVKEIEQPGVPIDQVARKVRAEVNRMAQTVNHEQVPAIYDQVIGQFYFYAQNDSGVDDVEILFWQSVKDSSDPAELQAYLDKYPDGQFSVLAHARIKRLDQRNVVPQVVPTAAPTAVTTAVPKVEPTAAPAATPEVPAVEPPATPPAPSTGAPAVQQASQTAGGSEQPEATGTAATNSATQAAGAAAPGSVGPHAPASSQPAQATAVKAAVSAEVEGVPPLSGPTVEAAMNPAAQSVQPPAGPTVEAAAAVSGTAQSAPTQVTTPLGEAVPVTEE